MRLCQRVGPAIYLHISLSHFQRVCPWELDNFSVSRQELLQSFSPFYFAAPSDIGQCVCTRPRTESFLISALFKGEFSAHFIQIFRSSERHHHRLVGWFLLQNSAIPSSRGRLLYIHPVDIVRLDRPYILHILGSWWPQGIPSGVQGTLALGPKGTPKMPRGVLDYLRCLVTHFMNVIVNVQHIYFKWKGTF